MTSVDSGDVATDRPYGISLLALINVALSYRRIIAVCAAVTAVLFAVWALVPPRNWTSTSAFMAQSKRSAGGNLSGIAEQFGFALPLSGGEESPAFYADLLVGRTILGQVVAGRYSAGPDTTQTRSFADLFEVTSPDSTMRRELAIRRLTSMVSASIVQRTGVVKVSVTTRFPDASVQINRRLLSLLNTFNLETRQSQALAERRFTEQRANEALSELRRAEDRQQTFLAGNRDFTGSPRLRFEQDRLARDVAMRQSIYTSLAQSLEQARIDEVRDTPAVTVLDPPELPVRPDSRGVVTRFILGAIVGALLGVLLGAIDAFMALSRENDPDAYRHFATLWGDLKRDLRHPGRAWSERRAQ